MAEARQWLEARGEDLPEAGASFIQASLKRHRRRRHIERVIAVAFAILATGAFIAAWVATKQTEKAQDNLRQAKRAVDTMLTEVGKEHLADFPQLADLRGELLDQAREFYVRTTAHCPSPHCCPARTCACSR